MTQKDKLCDYCNATTDYPNAHSVNDANGKRYHNACYLLEIEKWWATLSDGAKKQIFANSRKKE